MKAMALKARDLALRFLKWGWPLLLADAALEHWVGRPESWARSVINHLAFAWVLCAPVAPLSLLLDRARRERMMAKLCGLREGDERERAVTGEAARATLLLSLSLQVVLLGLSLVHVRLSWDPFVPKGEKGGVLSLGLAFSSERHLDPFGAPREQPESIVLGALPEEGKATVAVGGYLLSPALFPVLLVLILAQLAAFKAFALRRYDGDA